MLHEFHYSKTWHFSLLGLLFPRVRGGGEYYVRNIIQNTDPLCTPTPTAQNIFVKKSNMFRDVTPHNLGDGYQNLGEYCHDQLSKHTRRHAPVTAYSSARQADTLAIRHCHVYLDKLTLRISLQQYIILHKIQSFITLFIKDRH